jgi:hypothetical protein
VAVGAEMGAVRIQSNQCPDDRLLALQALSLCHDAERCESSIPGLVSALADKRAIPRGC